MTYAQPILFPQLPSRLVVVPVAETAAQTHAGPGLATWPAGNRAIYIPVSLRVNAWLSGISCWCAVTNSSNVDLGLYDASGVRLGSMGSTALTVGINTWTPANPILMQAGLTYYVGMAAVSNVSSFLRWNPAATAMRAGGYAQQATALPLPNPAVFAQTATAYVPAVALTFAGVPT